MTEGTGETIASAEGQRVETAAADLSRAQIFPTMDNGAAGALFTGPFDVFFGRIPAIPGLIRGILGRTAAKTASEAVAAGAEKAALTSAEAALRAEVSTIINKAASTIGKQSIKVSSREAAEQAAKEWVGPGARAITDNFAGTGRVVGQISTDGSRVARFTSANKPQPYINLVNRTTGGNLHVKF
jgi:hypothetical protein